MLLLEIIIAESSWHVLFSEASLPYQSFSPHRVTQLSPDYLLIPYFMASLLLLSQCLSLRPSETVLYFHRFPRSGLGSSYSLPQIIQFTQQTLLQAWGAHKSCWLGMNSPLNKSQGCWSSGRATLLSKNLVEEKGLCGGYFNTSIYKSALATSSERMTASDTNHVLS